jgi:hypothetical protein
MSLPTGTDIPRELATASTGWRKLRRMAAYAAFDGWCLAIFGACTLVCGGYGSVPGLFVSLSLLATGVFEIRCVMQLRRLNPSAVLQLACNQMVVAAALIGYAAANIFQAHHGGGAPSQIEQVFLQLGGSPSDIHEQVTNASDLLYFGLIAFALLVQGGTALYYLSRRPHLQRYLAQTPGWIQQMQRDRGEISL